MTMPTSVTSPNPNRITIEVTGTDMLKPPAGCSFIKEECVENPIGSLIIERAVVSYKKDTIITAREMLEREKKIDRPIGPNGAAALMRQRHLIPKDWQGSYLILTGCVVCDFLENKNEDWRRIACLFYHRGR